MKTFLIRPEYLDNLHELQGKALASKGGLDVKAFISHIIHVEPWGDDDRRGDEFVVSSMGEQYGEWMHTYRGNEGYRKFLKEWKVAE